VFGRRISSSERSSEKLSVAVCQSVDYESSLRSLFVQKATCSMYKAVRAISTGYGHGVPDVHQAKPQFRDGGVYMPVLATSLAISA
jgi:hypothetical protein